jgi:hypothetical protein
MQTLTVEIRNTGALKTLQNLEEKHFIKIVDDTYLDSPSLPGTPLSLKAFKNWISQSEHVTGVDLKVAQSKWANKRKKLQKLTR